MVAAKDWHAFPGYHVTLPPLGLDDVYRSCPRLAEGVVVVVVVVDYYYSPRTSALVRDLDLQRFRHPGPARPVLHARRFDAALRVPEPRALGGARLRRGEVHLERPLREGADLGLAAVHRDGGGGLRSRLVVEDPRSGQLRRAWLTQVGASRSAVREAS